MILINNINLPLDTDFSNLIPIASKALRTDIKNIISAQLYRKSVDARHKNDVHFCCSVLAEVKNEEKTLKTAKNALKYTQKKYEWLKAERKPKTRPIVVGFGPAGMFAALCLAKSGLSPIVIERGYDVDRRSADVAEFFKGGRLNENSNVQFGEGGAGTFSDGKLNTGIKDPRCRTVLESFVSFGAPENILIDAKPHIGTDILVNVVKALRNEIIRLGGEIRFASKFDGIKTANSKICAITVNGCEIKCEHLILATGHSARDTFELLKNSGIEMVRKPFAMGVRIEHLQSDINRALYGSFAEHPALHAADYKLAVHLENGRGVYTFCMCPGGEVINASSEENRIAVNGMSQSLRNGKNANSAVLVNVDPCDLEGNDVLAGCKLQRKIEENAYNVGCGAVPTVTLGEFLYGIPDTSGRVNPTVLPRTVTADLNKIFPSFITESLRAGIPLMGRKIKGFDDSSAILTAPETRSSSPVRIVRNENGESISISGLYPCGEGAGYAGGIMSAAVDGIRQAEAVINAVNQDCTALH